MKKLFLLGLIALNSSALFADEARLWLGRLQDNPQNKPLFFDEKAHCNPCWMMKRLVEIAHTSNDTKSVMEARELIQSKFGPECAELRALESERFNTFLKELVCNVAIVTAVVGGVVLVSYATKAVYDKIAGPGEVEEVTSEDIQV